MLAPVAKAASVATIDLSFAKPVIKGLGSNRQRMAR
jgi:hypothetical protein